MNREQIMAKIMAAAYLAAAELGHTQAVQMLDEAKRKLTDEMWAGPNNR